MPLWITLYIAQTYEEIKNFKFRRNIDYFVKVYPFFMIQVINGRKPKWKTLREKYHIFLSFLFTIGQLDFFYLSKIRIYVAWMWNGCPIVSNKRQNGWTDRVLILCGNLHDPRKDLWTYEPFNGKEGCLLIFYHTKFKRVLPNCESDIIFLNPTGSE